MAPQLCASGMWPRRCMALALAPHSIRVNAIGPGSIMTQVLQSVVTDEAARHRCSSQTF